MNKGNYALALAILIVSLSGYFIIGEYLINKEQLSRFIEVTGIAEKRVLSDNVQWVIPIKSAYDNLGVAKSQVEADVTKVVEFLKKYNIADNEIERKNIRVRDNHTDRYASATSNTNPRYVIDAEVVVKSNNINQVVKASQSIEELISQNITIAYDEYLNKGPKFYYSKFNEIDSEMIEKAVNQAKLSAEEFASKTSNKISKIKEASMDVVLISSIGKEEALSSNQQYYGGMDEDYGANKKLRVVAKVKYYLED